MTQEEFDALKVGDQIYHHDGGISDGAPLLIAAVDWIAKNRILTLVHLVTASNPEEWTKLERKP